MLTNNNNNNNMNVPVVTGIRGNEKADTAAKAALSLAVTPMKLPAYEFFPRVNKLISEDWQQIWENRVVHPCFFVLRCPLLRCPAVFHRADLSTPTLSTLAFSA